MDAPRPSPLRVVRAAQVPEPSAEQPPWLIEPLWTSGAMVSSAVPPKSCKSGLALELAVAVGSGARCLGRFAVPHPGTVLVFAAEDAPPAGSGNSDRYFSGNSGRSEQEDPQ